MISLRKLKIIDKLSQLSRQYGKPVLWVNGDSHRFIVDKPLLNPDKRSTILNFTRVQVFGDADVASVHITVNARSKELFTVRQMLVEWRNQSYIIGEIVALYI